MYLDNPNRIKIFLECSNKNIIDSYFKDMSINVIGFINRVDAIT